MVIRRRTRFPMSQSRFLPIIGFLLITLCSYAQSHEPILLKNVTVVDGSGNPAQENMNVLIRDGKISSLSKQSAANGATVIDFSGKTVMPLLTNVHAHIGLVKGTSVAPENFNRDQIQKEL